MASFTVDFILSLHNCHLKVAILICIIIIQLSTEGEVYSGGNIQRREASRYISRAVHQT